MNHDEKAYRFPVDQSLAEADPQHFDAAVLPGMRRQMTAMGERGRDATRAICAETSYFLFPIFFNRARQLQ